ncbi:hypothetical protein BGM19_36550 [Streptomyces agglomeratus]|nr:hypothetical protein BGM19_36550 [Streptomyces agglomeratus]
MMRQLVYSAGPAYRPAEDMQDLAAVIRPLLHVKTGKDARVRLGSGLFDVVITGGGTHTQSAVAEMDEIQSGCGPVIEDPDSGWQYWLVPPGSRSKWEPHEYGVCLGAPHTVTLPSLNRTAPPGPYWLRPSASDRLVPLHPLRRLLTELRPQPTPPASLAAALSITTP